jgi:hypothetical protein
MYGPGGLWAVFLGKAAGYSGTELRREPGAERRYRGFDFWRSHQDFEAFREAHQVECEQFAQWAASEGLVEREIWLGSFYQDERGGEDESGLVPA